MTDQTSNGPVNHSERKPRAEFWIYFALIFFAALPVAFGFCVYARMTGQGGPGPVARAWAKAWEITPLIFSV
ncbi:MAG: cytochrome PufQ [Pikeienuella sp.]|uniref:cytochrome PufQ n=1 Tax=Pikeienuella sp. TaxID=2831957 RepID=UPI00391D39E5